LTRSLQQILRETLEVQSFFQELIGERPILPLNDETWEKKRSSLREGFTDWIGGASRDPIQESFPFPKERTTEAYSCILREGTRRKGGP
jgi:hypothetical protein